MKRRQFIRNTAIASTLYPLVSAIQSCGSPADKRQIIVVIQLVGGNDGLNTLIPLDNYKAFIKARPTLYIPEDRVLKIKDYPNMGLHPALEGIKDMYENGLASFVQGVGYENQNYSHFRSADIYLTGSESDKALYTGWMARVLDKKFNNYPDGFPSKNNPDPPAIKVGETGTFLFQGKTMDLSIVLDPASNTCEISGNEEKTTMLPGYAGQEINKIREILLQTDRYSGVIKQALQKQIYHSKQYPKLGENTLADQLKIVAKMINGGLQTAVYHVDLKGFDTHEDQVLKGDTTKGKHSQLLKKVDQAITCFWEDMEHMNMGHAVSGFVFSEFGRRIVSNASMGTDHGSSQPLLLFGSRIHRGVVGNNPSIPDSATGSDNLNMQHDFRSVYAAMLKNWLNVSDGDLNTFLPGNISPLTALLVKK